MSAALLLGSTGLVGNEVLKILAATDLFTTLHTISRRAPKQSHPRLSAAVDADTTTWARKAAALTPAPSTVISALGTKLAEAGSAEAQWKIDHDLNIELARAAKEAGARNYVFVSSAGIRLPLAGRSPYSRMKVGVEDALAGMGFENVVVVRPGVIFGETEKPESLVQDVVKAGMKAVGWVRRGVLDGMGQDADVIAKAIVSAVRTAEEGKAPANPWCLNQSDIVRLGRTEWTG